MNFSRPGSLLAALLACTSLSLWGDTATLVRVEAWIGADPGLGNAHALDLEGASGGALEAVFPLADFATGAAILNVRALDSDGNWSPVARVPFRVEVSGDGEVPPELTDLHVAVNGEEFSRSATGLHVATQLDFGPTELPPGRSLLRLRASTAEGDHGGTTFLPVWQPAASDLDPLGGFLIDGPLLTSATLPAGIGSVATEVFPSSSFVDGALLVRARPRGADGSLGPAAQVAVRPPRPGDLDPLDAVTWRRTDGASGTLPAISGESVVASLPVASAGPVGFRFIPRASPTVTGPAAFTGSHIEVAIAAETVPVPVSVQWTLDGHVAGADPLLLGAQGTATAQAFLTLVGLTPPASLHLAARATDAVGTTGPPAWADINLTDHFTRWQFAHFTEAERANPLVSGALADADGDGVPNLAEYAFGSNPRDRSSVPQLNLDTHSGGNLVVTYAQQRGGSGTIGVDYVIEGVQIAAETAAGLEAASIWSSGPALFAPEGTPLPRDPDTNWVAVRLLDDQGTPECMIRIRASQQP